MSKHGKKSLDKIRAPYTFVPLSEFVLDSQNAPQLRAEWVNHDVPFHDAVCGTMEIALHALTPIFIRGADRVSGGSPKPERFFRLPSGLLAIPGSSLRGMLRNVLEIACFARMRRVNPHRYGVRDLHNHDLYGRHMSDVKTKKTTIPLVSAGWLRRNDDPSTSTGQPAHIVPCDFAKVHYDLLGAHAERLGLRNYSPGEKQSAPDKYRKWAGHSFQVQARVEWKLQKGDPSISTPRSGDYGVVTELGTKMAGPDVRQGELVFTGQPQDSTRKGSKQHDFVFFNRPGARALPVSAQVWEDFRFVHRDSGQQNRMVDTPNAELRAWLERSGWDDGDPKAARHGIPVFFLLEKDKPLRVRAIGLAMMFRLAYRYSVLDAVWNAQGNDRGALDLPDLIFGHVPLERKGRGRDTGQNSLRGRVDFGHGLLPPGARELEPVRAVLGAPKASYYPNYVEQDPRIPGNPPVRKNGKPRYVTWMDQGVRPRGWKRYPPRPQAESRPQIPKSSTEKVITTFQPVLLPSQEPVRIPVRVHNLRPFELGALLWALDFGGAPDTCHSLGMARSLGYGAVRLSVAASHLRSVDGQDVHLDQARLAFADFMETALADRVDGGWAASRQLHALIAAATVHPDPDRDLRHMRLDHPHFGNEFTQAKDRGFALSPPDSHLEWARAALAAQQRRPRKAPTSKVAKGKHSISSLSASTPKAGASGAATRSEPASRSTATERSRFRKAYKAGQHLELIRRWMEEGGERAPARRRMILDVMGKPSKKLKKKHKDLVAWLRR